MSDPDWAAWVAVKAMVWVVARPASWSAESALTCVAESPAIWVVTIGPAAIKFVQVLFPMANR